jgi:hypothetical protein
MEGSINAYAKANAESACTGGKVKALEGRRDFRPIRHEPQLAFVRDQRRATAPRQAGTPAAAAPDAGGRIATPREHSRELVEQQRLPVEVR